VNGSELALRSVESTAVSVAVSAAVSARCSVCCNGCDVCAIDVM